jgi:hypothetical protein
MFDLIESFTDLSLGEKDLNKLGDSALVIIKGFMSTEDFDTELEPVIIQIMKDYKNYQWNVLMRP